MTDFGVGAAYDRYGLGVFDQTGLAPFEADAVGNGGWGAIHSSTLVALPDEGIVIAVLTSMSGDPKELVVPVAQRLAAAVAG